MKKNYFLLSAKQGLLALVVFVSAMSHAQLTYTFVYTGAPQTLTLASGIWGIQCWGANGGSITSAGGDGQGGYSQGQLIVTSSGTVLNIYVGGKGGSATGTSASAGAGGWNGGGGGAAVGRSGGGGGGATDVRVGGIAASNRIIVAGGGGGAAYYGSSLFTQSVAPGGNGGAVLAQNGSTITSGGVITLGGGGAGANGATPGSAAGTSAGLASGGGGGGNSANGGSVGGQGNGGGAGGYAGTSGSGSTGSAGGGGGGYAGGAGGVQVSNGGAAGGGGSGYIGGVSSGTTVMFGTPGFIANPILTGDGRVLVTELCNFTLTSSNTNSLNPSICAGQSLTLTTNAISNYSWNTGSTASSLVVTPLTSTVYVLTATSPSNCTTSKSISVTVSGGQPTLSIVSSTNQVCLGQTATLTASGAVTYTWSNNVINGIAFTPSVTNTYTVIGINGCGTATAASIISITPFAVGMVANPTLVCAGSTSSITTVSAGTNFTWSPVSNNSSSLIVSPQVNTVYTVIASDGTCSGTASVSVSTKPIPTVAITPTLSNVCSGSSVTLTATGGTSYTWTANNATIVGNSSVQVVVPNAPTGFNVVGINSLGCTSGAAAAVITNPSPTLALSANPGFICANDPVSISVSGASTYVWDSGATTTSINVNPSVTTVYTVTGNALGCLTTETIEVTVFIPTIGISGTSSVCAGGVASVNSSTASSYAWTNGLTSQGFTIIPSTTTIYSLTALTTSSGINCPSSASFQVLVVPKPVVVASAQRTVMCKNESNTISVTGATTYSWGTGQTTNSFTVLANLITTNIYTVTGISNLGCSGTASVSVKVNACTSLNELTSLDKILSIYPNPNNGEFTVKANRTMILNLYNELGQQVKSFNLNSNNNFEFQIIGLSKGIYFVSSTENIELKQKIVVQ